MLGKKAFFPTLIKNQSFSLCSLTGVWMVGVGTVGGGGKGAVGLATGLKKKKTRKKKREFLEKRKGFISLSHFLINVWSRHPVLYDTKPPIPALIFDRLFYSLIFLFFFRIFFFFEIFLLRCSALWSSTTSLGKLILHLLVRFCSHSLRRKKKTGKKKTKRKGIWWQWENCGVELFFIFDCWSWFPDFLSINSI